MAVEHVNCKGDTYFLHVGKTKTGKARYFFSKKRDGALAESCPEGYETYENPNGRVFLRKVRAQAVTDAELAAVDRAVRQLAGLEHFKLDVRDDAIVIFLPDQDVDGLVELLETGSPCAGRRDDKEAHRFLTYSPMMRFVLADPAARTFCTERMCFLGPDDEWLHIGGPDDLEALAWRYCAHLGRDSFFELI